MTLWESASRAAGADAPITSIDARARSARDRVATALKRARFALAFLLAFVATAAHASLSAEVDRQVIDENDVVVLQLRYDGQAPSGEFDFERLQDDWNILDRQRSYQLNLIGGRPRAVTGWSLTLEPKRRGTLVIPPFNVAGDRTEPITVTVTEPTPEARRELAEWVFMETDISGDSVWVQEQLTYRVRLYYSEDAVLFGELPPMPRFEHAVIEPLGGASSRSEVRDGRRYQVIERRYAIIPQRSGELRLPPETFVGAVRMNDRGNIRRRNLRLATDGHRIEVRSQPAEWPADVPWLPARDLTLSDSFAEKVPSFRQGEPVSRILTLKARGLAASTLPEMGFADTTGVRTYPEPPVLDEDLRGDGFVSRRIESAMLLAQVVDFIEFPEIRVHWWDLDSEAVRTAVVPARRYPVAPAALPPPDERQAQAEANGATAQSQAPAPDAAPGSPVGEVRSWPAMTLLAILLWVAAAAFGAWHFLRRGRGGVDAEPNGAAQRAPAPAYSELLAACRANDPARARRALDDWLRARAATDRRIEPEFEQSPPLELGRRIGAMRRLRLPTDEPESPLWESASRAHSARMRRPGAGRHGATLLEQVDGPARSQLAPLLAELDRALFGAGNAAWDGRALADWARRLDRGGQRQTDQRAAVLPPLYPASK